MKVKKDQIPEMWLQGRMQTLARQDPAATWMRLLHLAVREWNEQAEYERAYDAERLAQAKP